MKKIIVMVGVLLTQFFAQEAWSYTFTQDFQQGIYWKSFPIDMKRFAVDASEGNTLQSIVQSATGEWESALGVNVWDVQSNFILATGGYSGNYIRWSNNFAAETGFDPVQTLAVTIRFNDGNYVSNSIILLNGGLSYLRANQSNILYKTVLHELGHTIGLDHSTANAIMQPYVGAIAHLTSDDVDGGLAAVDTTHERQTTNFQANLNGNKNSDAKTKMLGCGTVDLISSGGDGPGPFAPLFSFLVGLLIVGLGHKLTTIRMSLAD